MCLDRVQKYIALNRALLSSGLILLLSILPAACASPQKPPRPVIWSVSEESRASIRDVQLAPAGFKLQPVVSLPAKGAGEGAGRGAAIGAIAPMAVGAQGDAYTLALGIVLAPFTAVIGTGVGAANALPAEEVEKAEQMVNTAFSAVDLPERLALALQERVEDDTGRSVVATIPGPADGMDLSDYAADAVIEVRVMKVALEGPWSINPAIKFVLDARVRLIHLSNSQILWDRRLSYEGPELTLTEWSLNEASPLRKQFALGTTALAERIIDELFLLHVPRSMDKGPT
jgi:hypothetical protein